MKSLLTPYRVMANVVGVLLIVLVLIGVPLRYLTPQGSTAEGLGENICMYLGIAHGWLYMIFLVSAFALSRRARWSIVFTGTTLLAGTVPILSFWAERRATRDVRGRIAAQEQADGREADRATTAGGPDWTSSSASTEA